MFFYRVAEPNEALIVSGFRAHRGEDGDAAGLGFKIIVGKGVFVVPGLQKVRRLSLDIHEAELDLQCVTTQGIPIGVKAVVIYKIADDYQSIANAARRFLEQEDQMDVKVHNVFAGHLRSIVGTMTVEDLIRNRDKLTQATRESSSHEMQRLGLTIDSLQIQEIEDQTGYIDNLGMPEAARVAKDARIAQATTDREATEREQATAEQAGPLAAATARQDVVVQETKVAQLEAERTEQRLQTEVRRPADAEAYKKRTIAEADRDARISQAEAGAREGEPPAEADAIRARAEALRENQDAVINQQIAEELPQIVAEGAKAFGNIDQLTVLNGADGMTHLLNQIVGAGVSTVPMLRQLLGAEANGKADGASAPDRGAS